MIDFVNDGIGATAGLLTGIIGSYAVAECMERINYKRAYGQFDLCGTWAEEVPRLEGRRYSHGVIYYNKIERTFLFEGTNYEDDGEKHSHWQTITSSLEIKQKRLYYLFSAYLEGDLGPTSYGFGTINFTRSGDKYVPVDGYFAAPQVDTLPYTHSMVRVPIEYGRANRGDKIIQFMKSRSDAREPLV